MEQRSAWRREYSTGWPDYALDADLDLSKYRTVSICCKRFAINFDAAPLRADCVMSQN